MHTPTTKNLWGSMERSPLIWSGTVPKLMYGKGKELSCKVEHDRMLFNGCDRQHFSLIDEQIDEFNFYLLEMILGGVCLQMLMVV